jgi:hydroxypyruvate reductase
VLASAGTDGIDGPTDAAGVVMDAGTLSRGAAAGFDWRAALENNDVYRFAAAAGDLIIWGPTGTNVGDLHVLLVA